MENEVRHVANLKFLKLSFHVYEYDGRRWIPLVDIANGLGYKRPQKLYDLANRYKKRLHEKGRIIDLDSAPQRGLIVPNLGTINLAQKTNRATLLINYEGLVFLLWKSGVEGAEEFQEWAIERLVPAMLRHASKQTPLDDMTPEQRISYLREKAKLRRLDLERRMQSSPIWNSKQLVHEANQMYMQLQQDGRETEAAMGLLTDARELLDALKTKRDGPTLF